MEEVHEAAGSYQMKFIGSNDDIIEGTYTEYNPKLRFVVYHMGSPVKLVECFRTEAYKVKQALSEYGYVIREVREVE